MKERITTVQHMLDWIEENIGSDNLLIRLSEEVNYSPWYVSTLFHDVTGTTIRSYAAARRLTRAAGEIRDTDGKILDIAVKYGYSSQEAMSRVFKETFGCTPAAYRKDPVPLPFSIAKRVQFPEFNEKRINDMEKERLGVRVESIPAHKYMGIFEERAGNYGEFWNYQSCDEVVGTISSMENNAHPIVTAHTAGWINRNGKKTYFYGSGLKDSYDGPIPEGFTLKEIPGGDYLVFSYPAFDYIKENIEVMTAVEDLAFNFDPSSMGYKWDEDRRPIYQRHYPEKTGYEVLRPVTAI